MRMNFGRFVHRNQSKTSYPPMAKGATETPTISEIAEVGPIARWREGTKQRIAYSAEQVAIDTLGGKAGEGSMRYSFRQRVRAQRDARKQIVFQPTTLVCWYPLCRGKDRLPSIDFRPAGSRCVRGVCFQLSHEFRDDRLLSVPFLQQRVPGAALRRLPDIEDPAIQGRRSLPPRRQLG